MFSHSSLSCISCYLGVDSPCCAKRPPSYDLLMSRQFSRQPLLTYCNNFWQTDMLNYTSRDRYNFSVSTCQNVLLLVCCHVIIPHFRFLWRFSIGPPVHFPKYMILYWCKSDYKACLWSGLAMLFSFYFVRFFSICLAKGCFKKLQRGWIERWSGDPQLNIV